MADLPPLPIEVSFGVTPDQLAPEPEREPNPRLTTPNEDPRLHLNRRPGTSLVESLAPTVDALRQLGVDLGMRYYQVFSIVVRWSGGERGRGTPTVMCETPFLPVPKVEGLGSVDRALRPAGAVYRGDATLTQISPRYTADDIAALFPRALRDDEEHWIEVRGDGRDGNPPRHRFMVASLPERKATGWSVRLVKADEDRTRRGQVP